MSLRVLVTGARGQVGHELVQLAPRDIEVIGLGSTELDITDAARVDAVVDELGPDLIINAAAYTAVDKAESEPEQAHAVNRDGVRHLASAAERLGVPLFHISTDYVFSGEAKEPHRENDSTGPTGVYGASKLAGEQALIEHCSRYLILRTSWVFGAHGHNFVKTMLRLGREREEIGVVADQIGCPTSAAGIAGTLWQLAERYRQDKQLDWGTYHFCGSPACSWHAFAEEIFRQAHELGLLPQLPKVRPITTEDYPTPARRPAWSVLSGSKLLDALGIRPADWRAELTRVLQALMRMQP